MNTDKIILEIQQGDVAYNNLRQRLPERSSEQEPPTIKGAHKSKWISQKNLQDSESLKLLKRFLECGRRIDRLKAQLQDMEDIRLSAVNYDGGRKGSDFSDVTGNQAVRIATVKGEWEKEVSHWLDMFLEIYNLFESLPERKYRIIMTSRYLIGNTWPEVAKDTGYSEKNCILLNNEALLLMNSIIVAENTAQTSQNGSEQL